MADPVVGVPGWRWNRWDYNGKASIEATTDGYDLSIEIDGEHLMVEHDVDGSTTCAWVPFDALVALLEANGLTVVPIAGRQDGKREEGGK